MRVKDGVAFGGVRPVALRGMATADETSLALGYGELIVTAVTDGVHKTGSLHYVGRAFDFRTHHLARDKAVILVETLRKRLGDDWDVLFESPGTPNEHGHAEYDPT